MKIGMSVREIITVTLRAWKYNFVCLEKEFLNVNDFVLGLEEKN